MECGTNDESDCRGTKKLPGIEPRSLACEYIRKGSLGYHSTVYMYTQLTPSFSRRRHCGMRASKDRI